MKAKTFLLKIVAVIGYILYVDALGRLIVRKVNVCKDSRYGLYNLTTVLANNPNAFRKASLLLNNIGGG